jgi:hypothetical protein
VRKTAARSTATRLTDRDENDDGGDAVTGRIEWVRGRCRLLGAIAAAAQVAAREETGDGITTFRLTDGRRIRLLTEGHMVNLSGPRPLGNSIESMDLGFALRSRCLEAVARGVVGPEHAVVPVPRSIDEDVAAAYLELYGSSAPAAP